MKKISKLSILTFLALFAATLTQQGAVRAEDTKPGNWGQVPTVTSEWTHITAGSTTGFELKDDYYYVSENLTFTNTSGGAGQGSGMYVQAGREVHLYIPAGVTLTAIGADAVGTQGAGAGILLPSGTTLHILGEGTLVATGGNAANGGEGGKGGDAELDEESIDTWFLGKKILCGLGGHGGYGGGGAGAGIGTAGGNGGNGSSSDGERPQSYEEFEGGDIAGHAGNNGNPGTDAEAMGTIYIQSTITQQISGGAAGSGGAPGGYGKCVYTGGELEFEGIEVYNIAGVPIPVPEFDLKDFQSVSGGGGGGGGAGGGSAQPIGTGGAGGGGGGSGACGSACAQSAWVYDDFGDVGAGGGTGGVGTDGNNGTDGCTFHFKSNDNSPFNDLDDMKPGGVGGNPGTASVAQSAGPATAPSYNVSYYTVAVTPTKPEDTYSVGSSTTITLPSLSGGDREYKWILSIHGHAAGNTTSHCAAPNGDVYEPGAVVDLKNIYGDIEFCAVYVGCDIDCTSKLNNYWSTAWSSYVAGKYAVVKLSNRKFYRDGYWNTLTLPFSLDASKLANTCLRDADIRTFKNAAWDAPNQRLTINFSDTNDGRIDAGVPCLVRWGTPTENPGDVIEDPIFTNVQVDITDQSVFNDEDEDNHYETVSVGGLRFQAQIAPVQVTANSKTLLLGGENKLYKPDKSMWVYATRAYFTYTGSIAMAREFVMDFGESEQTTTYIDNITVEDNRESQVEGIFNLNGQRLDAPQKGINIINGKKVVIK